MPLSISSSSNEAVHRAASQDGLPELAYGRIWLVAICLCFLLIVTAEHYLRARDHMPSVTDTMPLWAQHRAQVYGDHTVVIIGSSRSQLGIVPEVLEEKLPTYRVVHLAINGTTPYAVFADLATDPNFTGIIVYDALVQGMVNASQQPWVDYYHQEWSHWGRLNKEANSRIQVFLQSKVNLFNSKFTLYPLISTRNYGPAYISTQPNRYRDSYYHKLPPATLAELVEIRIEQTASGVKFKEFASPGDFTLLLETQIRPLVQQVQARGGEVFFLEMPVSGEVETMVEEAYPKQLYWDQISMAVDAPALSFRDVETLRFVCPDGSHLDATDAPIFTANLVDELVRLGVVSGALAR